MCFKQDYLCLLLAVNRDVVTGIIPYFDMDFLQDIDDKYTEVMVIVPRCCTRVLQKSVKQDGLRINAL